MTKLRQLIFWQLNCSQLGKRLFGAVVPVEVALVYASAAVFAVCAGINAFAVPPDTSHFKDVRYAGHGCPPGSASAALYRLRDTDPPSEFAVYFSTFAAVQGPGISAGRRSEVCRVWFRFALPRNRQFAISQSRFDGFADIAANAGAVQSAEYRFPSGDARLRFQTVLTGEFVGDYQRTDTFNGGLLWSPCGRDVPFLMTLAAEVTGDRSAAAIITVDQTTGLMEQRFRLQWRDCF